MHAGGFLDLIVPKVRSLGLVFTLLKLLILVLDFSVLVCPISTFLFSFPVHPGSGSFVFKLLKLLCFKFCLPVSLFGFLGYIPLVCIIMVLVLVVTAIGLGVVKVLIILVVALVTVVVVVFVHVDIVV